MKHTPFYLLVVSVAVAGSPLVAHGQRATFLQSLATPPQSVGSCSAAPAPMQLRADAPVREFAGRQLELTTDGGRARRTMMVYTDRRGRPRQYAEMTGPGVGEQSHESAEVEAAVDTAGRVQGFLLRHTSSAPARIWHSRRELTAAEQRQVRQLAKWLVERCRA